MAPSERLPKRALLFVLATALQPLTSFASPPINVALQASFNSPPFLIELLETAAEEDSSVYFPLLDRIAEGYFDAHVSDKRLYDSFIDLLKTDHLIDDPETLSSFQLALSIRNSAPRIEAHYQYYNTSVQPLLQSEQGAEGCGTWLDFAGKRYCDPEMGKDIGDVPEVGHEELPFDRILGPGASRTPSILYADIMAKEFRSFHRTLSDAAREGKTSYRIRYRPTKGLEEKPLVVNGYGVELALKRTDYIVIDDRKKDGGNKNGKEKPEKTEKSPGSLEDVEEDVEDLKPLASSELKSLSLQAASFVVDSQNPLDTLFKLTKDFPKHSAMLINKNISEAFLEDESQKLLRAVPPGYNILWVNGVQYDTRKMDPFSLLDYLRRERKLIKNFQDMGISAAEAITLLSHPAIAESHSEDEVQRFDWRDEKDGGDVIIWLNNIEKDSRYKDWSSNIQMLLQRTFPGQLHPLRRDFQNVILPVDLADPKALLNVVDIVQDIIRRKVPIRWGMVPTVRSEESAKQARIAYHLIEFYGLVALMDYLGQLASPKAGTSASDSIFDSVIQKRAIREGKEQIPLVGVLEAEDLGDRISHIKQYVSRLAISEKEPVLLVNGATVAFDDEWLQVMSNRISIDLRQVQQAIFEDKVGPDTWLPSVFLENAPSRRSPLVTPDDESSIELLNYQNAFKGFEDILNTKLPQIRLSGDAEKETWGQLLVIGDFDSIGGLNLAAKVVEHRKDHDNAHLVFMHNPQSNTKEGKSAKLLDLITPEGPAGGIDLATLAESIRTLAISDDVPTEASTWPDISPVIKALRFDSGQEGLVLNGRKLGPITSTTPFEIDDIVTLFEFEDAKRTKRTMKAVLELGLLDKVQNSWDHAKICSLISVSTVSDIPEGIFELPPPVRTRMFYQWNETGTSLSVGDNSTAVIQLIATVDPTSEVAQKWVPVLKTLTELEGVFLRIFMNPREQLEELPVKRFYRYALQPKPSFDYNGNLSNIGVKFTGIPAEALLTLGMDVAPSWLVTPKDSIHDLDNIKLSSLNSGSEVDATYELEHILIEGHSRQTIGGAPPRGVQLVLSTAAESRVTDTIIMANLGYFQFKANPGHYNIELLPGRSQEIFHIDSVGAMGYSAQLGDESTEVTLLSFQGATLYPRLSRNVGFEESDVLEEDEPSAVAETLAKGAEYVDGLLRANGIINRAAHPGRDFYTAASRLGATALSQLRALTNTRRSADRGSPHADINIFSVASGHLYERMLNIMMVSVMRHTNHTVKFWFIEQFLSPSFKEFVPTMAKEYGFSYEMVTYKWPHWLRAQKEKQREIWGYKILFLDVLFPLDLDKVIFVDADQIVRTDMHELVDFDLRGAPYGFTPMCDSRVEMEGFRFWKQGYWKNFLRGLPYHISALYVVDLKRFRQLAAGDRLRQQYHQLSADPASLSNLDQDLPNHMQMMIPIRSLPQDWLWCETWCSDEALATAKTIDLCNNPMTKEPKLERARRQVPEWTVYDEEIAGLARRVREGEMPGASVQEEEMGEGRKVRERDEL